MLIDELAGDEGRKPGLERIHCAAYPISIRYGHIPPPLALRGEYSALPELRYDGVVEGAGLRHCPNRIVIVGFRPIAGIPGFDCPLCQFSQIIVRSPHRRTVGQEVAKGVQVVGERENRPPPVSRLPSAPSLLPAAKASRCAGERWECPT